MKTKHCERYLELDKEVQKKIDSIVEHLNGFTIREAKRVLSIAGRELEENVSVGNQSAQMLH